MNLVRVQAPVVDRNQDRAHFDAGTVDVKYLARLAKFVKIMSESGMYTSLSIYYPRWFTIGNFLGNADDKVRGKNPPGASCISATS